MNAASSALRTPKGQLLLILLALLLIAAPAAGGAELVPNLLAAVLPAVLIDSLWLLLERRRLRSANPSSALLTALILFMIVSPDQPWWVVAWTSVFAILAKRLVRTSREHIFNPAALALAWAPIAFGSTESWWGALGDSPWVLIAVLVLGGAFIAHRLNKFPLVLTFLACYFGFFTLASFSNPRAVAEMFRDPFLQAALFLAFFMLTDPPTSPNRYWDQLWYGFVAAGVAGLAQLLGAGQVYLVLGLLAANATLALVRGMRRRGAVPRRGSQGGTIAIACHMSD